MDGEPRVVMGLLWALIYQFSIRSQIMLEECTKINKQKISSQNAFLKNTTTVQSKDKSASSREIRRKESTTNNNDDASRKLLLKWCRARTKGYPGVDVNDFSSSWNNGMAFAALVNSLDNEALDFNQCQNVNCIMFAIGCWLV